MIFLKQNWIKLGLGLIILGVLFFVKGWGDDSPGIALINDTTSSATTETSLANNIPTSYVDAQLIANQFFIEDCKKGVPAVNPPHRLMTEMSFCITELKKVDERANYLDPTPKVIFSTTIGEYQIKIIDSDYMNSGIKILVMKDGKTLTVNDDYGSLEEGDRYSDYIYELWEAKTGLGDKVIVIFSTRGGTSRGSEQLKAIYMNYNNEEVIITPTTIISDDLVYVWNKESEEDYKNALAKEIGNLMRLRLRGTN